MFAPTPLAKSLATPFGAACYFSSSSSSSSTERTTNLTDRRIGATGEALVATEGSTIRVRAERGPDVKLLDTLGQFLRRGSLSSQYTARLSNRDAQNTARILGGQGIGASRATAEAAIEGISRTAREGNRENSRVANDALEFGSDALDLGSDAIAQVTEGADSALEFGSDALDLGSDAIAQVTEGADSALEFGGEALRYVNEFGGDAITEVRRGAENAFEFARREGEGSRRLVGDVIDLVDESGERLVQQTATAQEQVGRALKQNAQGLAGLESVIQAAMVVGVAFAVVQVFRS